MADSYDDLVKRGEKGDTVAKPKDPSEYTLGEKQDIANKVIGIHWNSVERYATAGSAEQQEATLFEAIILEELLSTRSWTDSGRVIRDRLIERMRSGERQ